MYDLKFVMLSKVETYDVADARFFALPVVDMVSGVEPLPTSQN